MNSQALKEVFEAYRLHPEFLGISIETVDQRGALDSTLLHIAARTGKLTHIATLVEAGADLNIQGDMGSTPLHEAALCGQAKAVELLLQLGANAELKNEFGQTAYDVAKLGSKVEVCKFLEAKRSRRRK